MMLWQFRDRILNQLTKVTLPEEIVRAGRRVLELQRAVLVLECTLHRLEKHERIPRAIAQLVLGEVRCDRVRPCRELLRTIEAMQVAVDANEHLLHEILSAIAVADRSIYEVQQSGLIPLDELREGALLSSEESRDDRRVVCLSELFTNG